MAEPGPDGTVPGPSDRWPYQQCAARGSLLWHTLPRSSSRSRWTGRFVVSWRTKTAVGGVCRAASSTAGSATERPGGRRIDVRALALAAGLGLASLAIQSPATALVAGNTASAPSPLPRGLGQLVVKLAPGGSIDELNRRWASHTESALLASRSIYLIRVPLDPVAGDPRKAAKAWSRQAARIVDALKRDPSVDYAEPNVDADSTQGERFHYWPNGGPTCSGPDSRLYREQPAAQQLDLVAAHRMSTGTGAVVAVLDTGIQASHPALAGRVASGGYDYVDDDAFPSERRDGVDHDRDGRVDEGYGHGTFVAGIVGLVAPDAKILPERVLDTEGRGNVFVVAEAIYDSVDAGADVINMSFGTADHLRSKVLSTAVQYARHAGVTLVGAAGNDGSGEKHYPAALDGVLAVGALNHADTALATFSAHGDWVDVAAPGVDVTSSLPCGYGTWSGTSMAAPFVSGGAALMVAVSKKRSADVIDHGICSGSDKVHGLSVHSGSIDLVRSLSKQLGH
jgi:subtilisin family serine protease